MGYAGYVSAKLPPPPKTDLESALQMIENMESLEILIKLVYNAAVAPKEEKYRRIKLSNPKIDEKLGQVAGCIESLQLMGWQQQEAEEEGGIEFLAIAPGKFMTMKEVRVIEAAKERLKKAHAEAAKERLRSIGASSSTSAVRVMA